MLQIRYEREDKTHLLHLLHFAVLGIDSFLGIALGRREIVLQLKNLRIEGALLLRLRLQYDLHLLELLRLGIHPLLRRRICALHLVEQSGVLVLKLREHPLLPLEYLTPLRDLHVRLGERVAHFLPRALEVRLQLLVLLRLLPRCRVCTFLDGRELVPEVGELVLPRRHTRRQL